MKILIELAEYLENNFTVGNVGSISYYRLLFNKLRAIIEKRMTKFIDDNSDINQFVDNVLKFASNYRFLLHKNSEDYEQKRIGHGRLVTCLFVISCYLVSFVRFVWTAIFPDKYPSAIIVFTYDYLIGGKDTNVNIISKIVLCYGFLQFLSGLLISQYKEFQYNNTALEFLLNYNKGKVVPLNYTNSRKVGFVVTMMSKVLLFRPLLHTIMFFSVFIIFMINLIYNYNVDDDNYIWSEITWNIIFLPCVFSIWSYVPLVFCMETFEVLYLRYKMKERVNEFCLYTDIKHISHVQLISQHNTVCKYIDDINKFGSLLVFGLYYMVQPCYMMALIVLASNQIPPIFKLIGYTIFFIIFTIILLVTRYVSRISELSRQPLRVLFRLMSENKLTLEERLKTMTYIERLMGPDIGLYCLDLFPMNSYEFYLFVVDCAKNYLLFHDLSQSLFFHPLVKQAKIHYTEPIKETFLNSLSMWLFE